MTTASADVAHSEGTAPQVAANPPPAATPPITPLPGYARPPTSELEARLSPLQFAVTQRAATEPPFQNAYWNNHAAGIYVDVATGEPLFSSADKFESGTGWPSFVRPIDDGHIVSHTDSTFGMDRTEVVSRGGASHLGHVFDDGPAPTHLRYCINSASLRFVPVDQLAAQGYGAYAARFGGAVAAAPIPDDTSNACAVPPPGETAGCTATLDVAIFARADGDDRVVKPAGVLEVNRGYEGTKAAVEITYDPAKLTYADLVASWTRGREAQSQVFARNDAEKHVATAKSLRVANAEPFRRE